MSDRETVIRLSTSIERMRAQIRAEEEQLQKRKAHLAEMEATLDTLIQTPSPPPAVSGTELLRHLISSLSSVGPHRMVGPPAPRPVLQPSDGDEAKSVTAALRHCFELNSHMSLSARDLIAILGLRPTDRTEGTVRQALKRLHDSGFLLKERDGVYSLNPARKLNKGVSTG